MDKHGCRRTLLIISAAGLVLLIGKGAARGQFAQNRDTVRVDLSSYPPEIRRACKTFAVKCGECHGLDLSLKPSMSSVQWTRVVRRMQAMASSHISDQQAQVVVDFLNYDESHRKARAKLPVPAGASDAVGRGRQFYFAQSCDACHSIAGKGGDAAASLTDAGARLSQDQILARMKARRAGEVMPSLPPETTDQQLNDLVEFLLTLKGSK